MGYWLTSDLVLLLVLPTHHTRRTTPYIGCTPTTNHTNHTAHLSHLTHYMLQTKHTQLLPTWYTTLKRINRGTSSNPSETLHSTSFYILHNIYSVHYCFLLGHPRKFRPSAVTRSKQLWAWPIHSLRPPVWNSEKEVSKAGQAQEGGQDTASRRTEQSTPWKCSFQVQGSPSTMPRHRIKRDIRQLWNFLAGSG